MRILIQDPETKSYFSGDDWDVDENRATEFGNVAQAEEFCRQQNLPLALVVVKFKDAHQRRQLPGQRAGRCPAQKVFHQRLR